MGSRPLGRIAAVGMGAVAAATMMFVAAAPAARADDPFADIVTAVDGDLAVGQASFALAATDFGNFDVSDGLATGVAAGLR
jgi:hypothetical protein